MLRAFKQGGIFIMPHPPRNETSVFLESNQVADPEISKRGTLRREEGPFLNNSKKFRYL
jgi:hypothetical protein